MFIFQTVFLCFCLHCLFSTKKLIVHFHQHSKSERHYGLFAIFSESHKSWFAFVKEPALHIEFVDSSLRGHVFKSFVLFNRRKGNSPGEREFGQNLNLRIQKNRKRINDVFLNIVDNKEQKKTTKDNKEHTKNNK